MASGNGLQMQSREGSAVRGLVINNFPENGIVVNEPFASPFGDRRLIADCYIGTDPTGLKAAPNALRGIFVQLPAQRWRAALDIVGNVISGNARSGIFVTSGTDIRIAGNRIGAAAGDALLPLANGASGMYLGSVSAVQVNANVIAFNRDVGVGTDRTAATVGAEQNVMTGNGQLGIDHGLDDVTLNDSPTRPPALPQFPLLLSALPKQRRPSQRVRGRRRVDRRGHPGAVDRGASIRPRCSSQSAGEFHFCDLHAEHRRATLDFGVQRGDRGNTGGEETIARSRRCVIVDERNFIPGEPRMIAVHARTVLRTLRSACPCQSKNFPARRCTPARDRRNS